MATKARPKKVATAARVCSSIRCTNAVQFKCKGCRRVEYCSPRCQKEHWGNGGHRRHCNSSTSTPTVLDLPPPGRRAAVAPSRSHPNARAGTAGDPGPGRKCSACNFTKSPCEFTASQIKKKTARRCRACCETGTLGPASSDPAVRSASAAVEEPANPCPICLDNEDDGRDPANDTLAPTICSCCGQHFCAACSAQLAALRECPVCKAPRAVDYAETFARWWKMVHGREEGRHTTTAQFRLAELYLDGGPGVKPNLAEAFRWQQQAAERGHPMAQYLVGKAHHEGGSEQGRHVPKDPAKAVEWWKKAAAQGELIAMYSLAKAHFDGEGVTKDLAEHVRLLRAAANSGHPPSMNWLACAYERGEGVEANEPESDRWHRKVFTATWIVIFDHFSALCHLTRAAYLVPMLIGC